MKILFFPTLVIGFLFSYSSQAQILNVEKSRLKRDTVNYWVGQMNFNLLLHNRSASKENPIRYTGIGLGADLAYISKLHQYMIINQLNYSSFTGNPFISTGFSHFRLNLWWKRKWSYEAFTQYQYDLGRGLKNRFLIGGGLRYTFIEEENIRVALGVGLMYEHERWEMPVPDRSIEGVAEFINTDFIKSSNYLSTRWQVNPMVDINSIIYFQTGYDPLIGGFRNRFSTDSNINVKLTRTLMFFTNFTAAYDSRPVVPIINFIYSLNNGLKVTL